MELIIKFLLNFLVPRKLPNPIAVEEVFPFGKQISVPNTRLLINSFYANFYNENLKATLLSCSKTIDVNKEHIERENLFCQDPRIIGGPSPDDYSHTGYDKGHLTPCAMADTEEEMKDTFLMTNMTPQAPKLNREQWRELEEHCKKLDTGYIFTGAIYSSNPITVGKHKIPVPEHYYKICYCSDNSIISYITENKNDGVVCEIELEELEQMIDFTFNK